MIQTMILNAVFGAVGSFYDIFCIVNKDAALFCQCDGTGCSDKQLDIQFFFKGRYLMTDCRLGHI